MAHRAVLRGVWVACGAVAAFVIGCLDDLPEAVECPPEAVYPGENCVSALGDVAPGCLDSGQVACLAGPRSSCTCIADECPASESACYPAGDCPAEVAEVGELAGGAPSCVHLAPGDIGSGLPSEYQCLCGCGGCMAACDGKGPVLGVSNDGNVGFAPITIDLAGHMPASGRIGVFVRERGIAAALVVVMKGTPDAYEVLTYYYMTSPIGTELTSLVFYDDPFLGMKEYSWSKEADRPTLLVIAADEGSSEMPALNLMEIDCVVPFVMPN